MRITIDVFTITSIPTIIGFVSGFLVYTNNLRKSPQWYGARCSFNGHFEQNVATQLSIIQGPFSTICSVIANPCFRASLLSIRAKVYLQIVSQHVLLLVATAIELSCSLCSRPHFQLRSFLSTIAIRCLYEGSTIAVSTSNAVTFSNYQHNSGVVRGVYIFKSVGCTFKYIFNLSWLKEHSDQILKKYFRIIRKYSFFKLNNSILRYNIFVIKRIFCNVLNICWDLIQIFS